MNRKSFLQKLGLGAVTAIVASKIAKEASAQLAEVKKKNIPYGWGDKLLPALTKVQMDAKKDWPIGLMVYQKDWPSGPKFWTGSSWASYSEMKIRGTEAGDKAVHGVQKEQ